MPIPTEAAPWQGSLLWLLALALAAFLVSWLVTDRWHAGRTPYVAVLAVVTAVFTVGYLTWAGISAVDFVTTRWLWGVVAALLTGAVLAYGMTHMAATVPPEHGARRAERLAWEGVVYGVSEGLLLSTLPALMTWEAVHELGWSGAPGTLSRALLPLVASVVVIVVHHLGYPEFRAPREMALPVVGCGLLTVAFQVTGNLLTAPLGHVIMHGAAVLHRTELPPHREPAAA